MRKIYDILDQIFNKLATRRRSDLKNDHKLIYSLGNTRTLEACISRNSYYADSDIR